MAERLGKYAHTYIIQQILNIKPESFPTPQISQISILWKAAKQNKDEIISLNGPLA